MIFRKISAVIFLVIFWQNLLAQSPAITYSSPKTFVTGTLITPLIPANSGGAVPAANYAEVTTLAKSYIGNYLGFSYPTGIACDKMGNVFISDIGNFEIKKLTPGGIVSTLIGNESFAYVGFRGMTIDASDNLYVTDWYNNKINKISPSGVMTLVAGTGEKSAINGPAATATFSKPSGIVMDAAGNIFIVDQSNNQIRKISTAGVVSTFAGSSTAGAVNGVGTAASFNNPESLVMDATGNIYVTDTKNNLIRKITPAGIVTTFAGNGTFDSVDGTGLSASFRSPSGIAIDRSGNLYVTDFSAALIRKITPAGVVTTLAGRRIIGSDDGIGTNATFDAPISAAMDLEGNLLVSDAYNNRLRKIILNGYTIDKPLPAGLLFDPLTGTISGVPIAASEATDYTVTAYNIDGFSKTILNIATVVPDLPPVISSFLPLSAPSGAYIKITGDNLLGATAISAGGVNITDFHVISSFEITFRVPPGAKSGDVLVTTSKGTGTLPGFVFIQPPNISYQGVQNLFSGIAITPLLPGNTGGAIPANPYGLVSAFAGSGLKGSADGTVANASFNNPHTTAVDGNGNVYVTDTENGRIRKITSDGIVSTLAGSVPYQFRDGMGSAAALSIPRGTSVDGLGNLYVADIGSSRVRKVTPQGLVTTYAGNGLAAPSGIFAGIATEVDILSPASTAVDAKGNVYVLDNQQGLLRKITPDGKISTFAGNHSSSFPTDGVGTAAKFNFAEAMTADAAGNLYVGDYATYLRKVTPAGLVTTIAGGRNAGSLNGVGTAAQFGRIFGLTVDAIGNIYILDQSNNQIRMMSPEGLVSTFAGDKTPGTANGIGTAARFTDLQGISTDGIGYLYITEGSTNLIRKISISGFTISPQLPAGLTFNSGTGEISGTPTVLCPPTTYTVKAFANGGISTATLTFGIGIPALPPTVSSFTPSSAGVGGLITIKGANFLEATSVTIGGEPALSFTIQAPDLILATVSEKAISGSISVTNTYGTGTLPGFTRIPGPVIAYNSQQNYTVGEAIVPVVPVNSGAQVPASIYAQISTIAGNPRGSSVDGTGVAASFVSPLASVMDKDGNLYVADFLVVRKIRPDGVVTTLAGSASNAAYSDGLGPAAGFYGISGITIDQEGNLYVTDSGNNRVRKITPAGVVTTIAGNSTRGSTNGKGTLASFNNPSGIVIDANGNLFIADGGNNLIRRISQSGEVTTLAGNGATSLTDGMGSAASFNLPSAITIDPVGNLYVVENKNHVVRKISPLGAVTTFAGSGAAGSANGLGAAASFKNPTGITIDNSGTLYVADNGNNIIRKITAAGLVTTLVPVGNGVGNNPTFSDVLSTSFDPKGFLYITDSKYILKLSTTGYSISPGLPGGLQFDATTGTISGTPENEFSSSTYTVVGHSLKGTGTADLTISAMIPKTAPSLTSIAPVSLSAGEIIIIKGNNLVGATAVQVGGVNAAYTVVSSIIITAVVPVGASSGDVTVTNPYGTASVAGFVRIPSPTVSYITPKNYTINLPISNLSPTGSPPVPGAYTEVSTYASAESYNTNFTTFDRLGNLYISETSNHRIKKITPAGVVTIFAGSGVQGYADDIGTSAKFNNPYGLVTDAFNNIYVADGGNNRIRKITPDGVVSTFAGNNNYTLMVDGKGTEATFNGPSNLTIDASGNLYVTDVYHYSVRKITGKGFVSTLAGNGKAGTSNGTGAAASFKSLSGITIDATGDLYVTDLHAIRKISASGLVSNFSGNINNLGATNGTLAAASFNYPQGILAGRDGNIYVADQNDMIRLITPDGIVSTLAGNGRSATVNGVGIAAGFDYPSALSSDHQGNLYVTDRELIRKIKLTGYTIYPALPQGLNMDSSDGTISGTPTVVTAATTYTVKNFASNGSAVTSLTIATIIPAVAPVATSFTPTASGLGGIIRITGTGLVGATAVSIGGVPVKIFNSSTSILSAVVPAGASSGSIAITNAYGTTTIPGFIFLKGPDVSYTNPPHYTIDVPIADLKPVNNGSSVPGDGLGVVSAFAGGATPGKLNGTGTAASFSLPFSSVMDSYGNIFVADGGNNLIRKITQDGVVSTFAGSGLAGYADGIGTAATFYSPAGIAIDGNGILYVADRYNNRIRKITPAGVVTTLAGSGGIGAENGVGAAASFYSPVNLVVDQTGNVYVSDYFNNQIRKITPEGVVSTLAGNREEGYVNGDGAVARFNIPAGLAIDAVGNLYVGDVGNSRIRKITPAGFVTDIAGSGGQGSDDGPANSATFDAPFGVAVDQHGNIYVAEIANNKIRMINTAAMVSTLAGSGTEASANGTGKAASFANPTGVLTDFQGNLYVTERHAVKKVSVNGFTISPALPAGLTFDSTTGIISGTPTVLSPYTTYTISAHNATGSNLTTLGLSVVIPAIAPALDSFKPTKAIAGTTITITGSNLLGATAVTIGGASAPFNVISKTTITARVPSNSASGDIVVTNPYGSNALTGFQFLSPPSISYPTPQFFTVANSISPIVPTNSGTAIPGTIYSLVNTLAGGTQDGSTDGSGTAARFYNPAAIATDAAGNIYAADQANHKIRKITSGGIVTTLAGSGSAAFADGTGSAASFNSPAGIAIDVEGNILVADYQNNRIRKITPAGVVTTFAGSGVLGASDGDAASAKFYYPQGIVVDAAGNVYVSERNQLIRKITPAGQVSTFAGKAGVAGVVNGSGAMATFAYPAGLAIDASENIYVADRGNKVIRKITPQGLVSTFATGFSSPVGVATDKAGNVYVTDADANVIKKINSAGTVSLLAGGSNGVANGVGPLAKFSMPSGIAFDGLNSLLVADQQNNMIRKVITTGYQITPALPAGLSFDLTTGTITGTPTSLSSATDYVVRAFGISGESSSVISISVGLPTVAPTISTFSPLIASADQVISISGINFGNVTDVNIGGLSAKSFTIVSPSIILAIVPAGAKSGDILLANPYGSVTVSGFTYLAPPSINYAGPQNYTTGTAITPLNVTNTGGEVPATIYSQVTTYAGTSAYGNSNGLINQATFANPTSVVSDGSGNIYVADASNTVIRKISVTGVVSTFAGNGSFGAIDGAGPDASFSMPYGLTIDANANIYVADTHNHKIRKITPAGNVSTFAGTGIQGSSNGTTATASFQMPQALVFDRFGNLFVADGSNGLIRKITPSGVVTTLAGTGYGGFVNGAGTLASFDGLRGIAADADGNLYVTDSRNNCIRKITQAGVVTTFAGSGVAGYEDGAGPTAKFNAPMGISVDVAGNVYVGDSGNLRVRMITPDGVVSTLAGNGAFGSLNGIGTATSFANPYGVHVDAKGNLFVADQRYNQIRKIITTGYSVKPELPKGLSFSTATGAISGTPTMASPATSYTISARNTSGLSTSILTLSTVPSLLPPVINSFSPVVAPKKAVITITGTDFIGTTAVHIGGIPASSFYVVSPTTIKAIIANTATSGEVRVVNGVGQASLSGFSLLAAPDLSYSVQNSQIIGNPISGIFPSNAGGNIPAKAYGTYSTLAGNGSQGLTNGPAAAASFNRPTSCAADQYGNTYVADHDNHVIRKINAAGIVTVFAGIAGVAGYVDGAGYSARFNSPTGIVTDLAGNIYVAETVNCKIRKITPEGMVSTFAGKDVGYADGVGTAAKFWGPGGMTIDALGNLYVADISNNMIRKITPDAFVSTIAGSTASGAMNGIGKAATFNTPIGIAVDVNNNLYVADNGNHLIRKIDPSGLVTTLAGKGTAGAEDGKGTLAGFFHPQDIAIDKTGNLYVADHANRTIRLITVSGMVHTLAGSTNSIIPNISFMGPNGVTLDETGNLLVTDIYAHSIKKIALTGYSISPNLPAGLNFNTSTGEINGTPAALATLKSYSIFGSNLAGLSIAALNLEVVPQGSQAQQITFSPFEQVNYGAADFTPNASASSGLAVSYSSSDPAVAQIVNGKIHILKAGTVTITAAQTGNAMYGNAISVSRVLQISPAIVTITAEHQVKDVGAPNPELTFTYSGFVNGETTANLTAVPIASTTATINAVAGTYPITVAGAVAPNYTFNYIAASLTVRFGLPANNFRIAATSLSCKDSNNGAIKIDATANLNYSVNISGEGINVTHAFTQTLTVDNLLAGTYNVCITLPGVTGYQKCYTVVITKPKDLSVYTLSSIDNKNIKLALSGGRTYNIQLNGVLTTTKDSTVTLPLTDGKNLLTVTTDVPCQGVVNKVIMNTSQVSLYPNPFEKSLSISLGLLEAKKAIVEIYSAIGTLLYKKDFQHSLNNIELDLSGIQVSGTYVLKLTLDGNQRVFKIIKK